MKTKTFEISEDLFIESGLDLLTNGKKLSKQAIIDNINNGIYRIVTLGSVDLTIFPIIDNYEEEIGMSFSQGKKIVLTYYNNKK